MRVRVTQLVPRRSGPVGHRVRLSLVGLRTVTEVEFDARPFLVPAQSRFGTAVGIVGRVRPRREIVDLGQLNGQHLIGQGDRGAVLVVDDRERFAPVALAGEQPVAQTVLSGLGGQSLSGQPFGDLGLRRLDLEAVDVDLGIGRVDHHPGAGERSVLIVVGRRLHGADIGQSERLCEVPVAGVFGGYGHDRSGAVAHEHIVGDEDRNLRPGGRIERIGAGEDAGLLTALLPVGVGLGRGGSLVGGDRLGGGGLSPAPGLRRGLVPSACGQVGDLRMFGAEHEVRGPEEGVRASGVDLDVARLITGDGQAQQGALRPADPVDLHRVDRMRPVQHVEVVDEPVGVGGDPHVPLAQPAGEDRVVSAFGQAFGGDLFVGQHCAESRAPVDRGFGDVGEAEALQDVLALRRAQIRPGATVGGGPCTGGELLDERVDRTSSPRGLAVGSGHLGVVPGVEDLQEDPLRPFDEVVIGRGEAATHIVGQPQATQLLGHVRDIGVGGDARMLTGLHRVEIGGQPEGVIGQGVHDVVSAHPLVAAVDVGAQVAQRVADVQSRTGGVREHVHDVEGLASAEVGRRTVGRRSVLGVELAEVSGGVRGVERARFLPRALPRLLDLFGQRRVIAETGLLRVRRHYLPSLNRRERVPTIVL